MSYDYKTERAELFTEDGMDILISIRDTAMRLIDIAGACTAEKAISKATGSSWTMCAALDYLVERGELKRVCSAGWTQHHVYTKGQPT